MQLKFFLISLSTYLFTTFCLLAVSAAKFNKSEIDIEPIGQIVEGDGHLLPNEGICTSKDVRNNPANLKMLTNCSVIVGSLMLVLMEWSKEEDFTPYTFPNLREVTDYVIFYRVEGLPTLGKLFPNLNLIRGQNLFMDYALTIYEMSQLQEIGLRSLTTIQRGFVRIEHNAQLCYVDTIDWFNITGKNGNHFGENGNSICPGKDTCRGCEDKNCWSAIYCQRKLTPCHEECLGGCKRNGNCYRCKNLLELNRCVPKCSKDRVEYKTAHRCITKEMCYNLFNGRGWIWDRKCITKCPDSYKEVNKNNKRYCEKCLGGCTKICFGSEITTIAEAQIYRGCKIINGSLQIRLSMNNTDDLMKEMEDNLGSIEEITGYLKVYRAIPITSLSFFKNLTLIRGEELEYSRYSLIVYEMDNLQSLWNWNETKSFKIARGTVFFHFNSKLCLREIEYLKNVTKVNTTEYDVSTMSNGFKVTCHLITLETESNVIDCKNATITFQRYLPGVENNGVQGYYVYYIENPEDDIKEEYGRDFCFGNEWKSVFVPDPKTVNPSNLTAQLTNLNAYTRYGYYVETYNAAKGTYVSQNGKSVIKFFKTEMDLPSMPLNVQTKSDSTDSLTLYWEDDPKYTGIITRYIVELYIQLDETKVLDLRNYCHYPLEQTPTKEIKISQQARMDEFNNERECNCRETEEYFEKLIENNTSSMEINSKSDFQINCHKEDKADNLDKISDILSFLRCETLTYQVDTDNTTHDRKERNTEGHINPKDFEASATARPPLQNVTHENKFHYYSSDFMTHHKNYTLFKLKHFSRYMIYFAACKGKTESDCGVVAMVVQRTMKDPLADNIDHVNVRSVSKSSVEIAWNEPSNPNGIIVSYTLQYKMIGIDNFKPVSICITRLQHEKNQHTYLLKNLLAGEYSISVRATSLAGDGNFTVPIIFNVQNQAHGFDWILFVSITLTSAIVVAGFWIWFNKFRIRRGASDSDLLLSSQIRFMGDDRDGRIEIDEFF